MTGIMAGLLGLLVVVIGIGIYQDKPWKRPSQPGVSDGPEHAMSEELHRLREAESEVERTCRETQEAIIRRAMWRALRPHGGGQDE